MTFNYLDQIPFRNAIKDRLEQIWNFPKYSSPSKEEDKYYFFKNDGLQNQSVLYIQDDLESEPRVFIDPNKLSEDGTTSLTHWSVSNDGKYMAYGIAKGGSDWREVFVKDVETGEDLEDHLHWIKFSGLSWRGDGFYYASYDPPQGGSELSDKNEYHKVYYHKLGTSQDEDELIHKDDDNPMRNHGCWVTEDERFLILYVSETTSGNALYYKDLEKGDTEFKPISTNFESDFSVIDNVDGKLLIVTNYNAPKKKIFILDTDNPDESNWTDLIPESENVLRNVDVAGGKMILNYTQDASSRIYVYTMEGEMEKEIELPGIGNVGGFSGNKDDDIGFYTFTSFTSPSTIFKYNVSEGESTIFRTSEIDFDMNEYETKQIFYKSKDGTEIPMFITHKKGIEMNGTNPTLLYGYGGFNISIMPRFSISNLILLENGGIYAVANLRGGGEYGEEWHEAGTKLQKQNVFDDFISAAEYLIDRKYTSSEHLAVYGRSNGGLLIGACMTQRPDLYKVAFPAVGVLDMLRYHKFTIGWAWVADYGSSEDSSEFQALYKYSPLHNVKEAAYPATMVTTADHDDRVVPAHSFKFISELQAKHTGDNPVLIRIETMAGHGAGKPTSKIIEEEADKWSFMFYNIGVEPLYGQQEVSMAK